jgi:uncharacterized DUF497 family protein
MFKWDHNKNNYNIKAHDGIDFEEASSVFRDRNALFMDDPDHSEEEERFLLLGMSKNARLIKVSHCYREDEEGNEIIRIISARKAEDDEPEQYAKGC